MAHFAHSISYEKFPNNTDFDELQQCLVHDFPFITFIRYREKEKQFDIITRCPDCDWEPIKKRLQSFCVHQEDRNLKAAWKALREERHKRLSECDWTQLQDVKLNNLQKLIWTEYRQCLRDLPQNTKDPYNPLWPTSPQSIL